MSAIKDAALQRLRPILMTSASTVLGLIPLAFASGEGANQRIAMGTAVVGGMVVSTLLTMYIVPAIYSYISTNRIKITKKNETEKYLHETNHIYSYRMCLRISFYSEGTANLFPKETAWKKGCKTIILCASSITKNRSARITRHLEMRVICLLWTFLPDIPETWTISRRKPEPPERSPRIMESTTRQLTSAST